MIGNLDARRGRERGFPRASVTRRRAGRRKATSSAVGGWDRRGYVLRRLLLLSDMAALGTAYAAMIGVNAAAGRPAFAADDFAVFIVLLPVWVLLASLLGLYHLSERRIDRSFADELGPAFLVMTLWSWFWLVGRTALHAGPIAVLPSLVLWVAGILAVPSFRTFLHWQLRGRNWYRQAVVVIGCSRDIERVTRRIDRHPECALDVVATMDIDAQDTAEERDVAGGRAPFGELGSHDGPGRILDRAVAMVRASGADRVIVTGWPEELAMRTELIQALINSRAHVDLVSGEPEALCSTGVLHHLEGLPMLTVSPPRITHAKNLVKRTIDLSIAGLSLIVLSPLLVYAAIRIKLDSRGPIFFRQERVGRDAARFQVLKFRTMVADADARKREFNQLNIHAAEPQAMFKIPGDPRITSFGTWLRRWSLDELPQLWNVLRGEMSLVGPRPLIPEEAELVDGYYAERMRMRPGITGPWQILGRSDIPFEDMVRLDYMYVTTWTLREDLRLLLRTLGAVTRARGAY